MRALFQRGARAAAVAVLAFAVTASSAGAQSLRSSPERQAERAVNLRQSLFRLINYGYSPMGDMLKGRVPFDAQIAQKGAAMLVVLAPVIKDAYKTDTRAFEVRTWARDEIWTQKTDFESKSDSFSKAVAALDVAARGGDEAATLRAAAAVGRTCKACHDGYTR